MKCSVVGRRRISAFYIVFILCDVRGEGESADEAVRKKLVGGQAAAAAGLILDPPRSASLLVL